MRKAVRARLAEVKLAKSKSPTKDDQTSKALMRAYGLKQKQRPVNWAKLKRAVWLENELAIRAGKLTREEAFSLETIADLLEADKADGPFTEILFELMVELGYLTPTGKRNPHPWILDWVKKQRQENPNYDADQKAWFKAAVHELVQVEEERRAAGLKPGQAVQNRREGRSGAAGCVGSREDIPAIAGPQLEGSGLRTAGGIFSKVLPETAIIQTQSKASQDA